MNEDLVTTEVWTRPDGAVMRVHSGQMCKGETCVVHNPTEHSMRDWPLHWREDRGIFERICSHGTGHPDPDQYEFWRSTNQGWQAIHGCCGCCLTKEKA